MLSVGGSRSILGSIVTAKATEIEFGGKPFELSDVALANCRELLKRLEVVASQRK
jgi:hypothetical protein